MRPTRSGAVLAFAFSLCLFAQEGRTASEPSDPWLGWKWANFAILALGLGYLIRKHVPALFAQRSQEIQRGIQEATKVHQEAEERAAAIERRLASLEGEIETLRDKAHAEIRAEGERIQAETERRVRSIQEQARQEITLMSRGIRDDLRDYSAQLALEHAEQRIRTRITPETESRLVDGFLEDLRGRLRPEARN